MPKHISMEEFLWCPLFPLTPSIIDSQIHFFIAWEMIQVEWSELTRHWGSTGLLAAFKGGRGFFDVFICRCEFPLTKLKIYKRYSNTHKKREFWWEIYESRIVSIEKIRIFNGKLRKIFNQNCKNSHEKSKFHGKLLEKPQKFSWKTESNENLLSWKAGKCQKMMKNPKKVKAFIINTTSCLSKALKNARKATKKNFPTLVNHSESSKPTWKRLVNRIKSSSNFPKHKNNIFQHWKLIFRA